jgi:hypothetical protein
VPQVGDGVIPGYIVSAQGGGAVKRFVIGFGAGTTEMDTVVEGYAVTPQGWRKLGSGTLISSGSKTSGMVVPAAVATANPIGLIVVGGYKIYSEASGKNTLEAGPKRPPTQFPSSSRSDSRIGVGSAAPGSAESCGPAIRFAAKSRVGGDARRMSAGGNRWLAARVGQRQLHAPVLRLALRRRVRGDRIRIAKPLCRHEIRLDAL